VNNEWCVDRNIINIICIDLRNRMQRNMRKKYLSPIEIPFQIVQWYTCFSQHDCDGRPIAVYQSTNINKELHTELDNRLCGLVVRVSGYRFRGPGFGSRLYQIF
jgi:hypothetical protein